MGVFERQRIRVVLHFTGSVQVAESTRQPLAYYRDNNVNSRCLIEAYVAAGTDALVFSSTAAVYGNPARVPVDENAPTGPLNPWCSKPMTEQVLRDTEVAHRLRYVIPRYLNMPGTTHSETKWPSTRSERRPWSDGVV